MMPAFDRLATVTASTKRSAGIASGLEVGYTTEIVSLKCLPLHPVDPELLLGREGLAFHEVLQTAVDAGLDILEGDLLVIATVEYNIRSVAEWPWRGNSYAVLIVEQRK